MPYSPDPVLELYIIEPGGEDDTWGEKLNTNQKRLAEASHGRVLHQFLPGQASYTLDDTDFTGTESHKAILQTYGTITSDIEVVVPARSHLWHVFNATTGAFKTRIKTTVAGAPNVELAAGEKAVVFSTSDSGGVYAIYRSTDFLRADGSLPLLGAMDANNKKIINVPHPDNGAAYDAAPVKWVVDYVETRVAALVLADRQLQNPVGHFVINTSGINPATYLGFGTWVPFGGGTFLACAGIYTDINGDTVNINGPGDRPGVGNFYTTLTQANLPSVSISTKNPVDNTGGFAFLESSSAGSDGATVVALGSSTKFSNIPPLSVAYVWRRIA